MIEIEFDKVRKVFGWREKLTAAVDGVSWRAVGGEIFGLLGPNGAGKTTMIRMMLDILRPDEGLIRIDGDDYGTRSDGFKHRVGYLPEERGLYKKRKVLEVLVLLATLKGLTRQEATRRAEALLDRFGLARYAHKKVDTLSKGMSQKVQIASCVLHDPDLVVFDEPFSGLDPVNVRLVRDLILEMKDQGKLVFLSTHMMAEIEAVCDRIFMIHRGRQLLYGRVSDIRSQFTDYQVVVDLEADLDRIPCVARVEATRTDKRVYLRDGCGVVDLMRELGHAGRPIRKMEEGARPLEEIFVHLVAGDATRPASTAPPPSPGASS